MPGGMCGLSVWAPCGWGVGDPPGLGGGSDSGWPLGVLGAVWGLGPAVGDMVVDF